MEKTSKGSAAFHNRHACLVVVGGVPTLIHPMPLLKPVKNEPSSQLVLEVKYLLCGVYMIDGLLLGRHVCVQQACSILQQTLAGLGQTPLGLRALAFASTWSGIAGRTATGTSAMGRPTRARYFSPAAPLFFPHTSIPDSALAPSTMAKRAQGLALARTLPC